MTIPVFAPPVGIAFPFTRSAMWKTFHQEAVSGKDTPLSVWSYPRWQYSLTADILRSSVGFLEYQYMAAFYNSVRGSAGIWQYNDPDDGSVTAQAFGTGDGATTSFQLYRSFGSGSTAFIEPVFATIGTPIIFNNGTPDANVTFSNGVVTFTDGAPANASALTWTGSFGWLCRFDNDNLEFSKFMSAFWELQKTTFTTVKL